MPSSVTNYKCPNCGGPLRFDPEKQKLVCDNCGSTFTPEEIDKYFQEKNEQAVAVEKEKEKEKEEDEILHNSFSADLTHLKAYHCPSCGAELIADENTAASSCPYCGNPTIIPSKLTGALKPDYIIPFSKAKKEIIPELTAFYKNKFFLPKNFKEENHIEEVKGVYVPFWMYDGESDIDAQYHATRVRTFTRGDDEITETSHYQIYRRGSVSFEGVPADASSKMPDDHMDAIEPYKLEEILPFEMGYLTGFYADKYDVSSSADAPRMKERVANTTVSQCRSTAVGYATLVPVHEDVDVHIHDVHYVFLPVWVLSTRYKDKNYLFTMNGQTGKVVSDKLPLNWSKLIITFLLITGVLMVVFYAVMRAVLL
jgi:DNA-directed RNA polymerase subunit RPC12/RpoP